MFFTIDDVISGKKQNVNIMWITSIKNGDDTKSAPNFELLLYQGDGGRPLVESFATAAERKARREAIIEAGSFFILDDIHYNIVWVQSIAKVNTGDPLVDGNLSKKPGTAITFANGRVLYGMFDTEAERDEFYNKLLEALLSGGLMQRDTFGDFPANGNPNCVYLAKDTGQTYYWDKNTKTYIKTGTAGRTGVYSTALDLPDAIGATKVINKTDLTEILAPTVPYSEGSEVIGNNSIHGIIVSSDATTVTVKTITDLVIDSFQQVSDLTKLPTTGLKNILYYVDDIDEFRIWDEVANGWVEPFHPIIFDDVNVADARTYTIYVVDNKIKYTTDNLQWIEINKHVDEYNQNIAYHKDMFVYLDENVARVVADYTSDATKPTIQESFDKDIDDGKLIPVGGGAKLDADITSNVDCGAAPKGSFFPEGMTFQAFAEKILRKDIVPTISTSFSNSGTKQAGTSVASTLMKLTITNLADVTVPVNKIDFYLDGVLVDSQSFVSGKSVYQYNYTTAITSNIPKTITAKAVLTYQTSKTAQGSGNFVFVYPSLYGVTKLASITDADATTLAGTFSKSIKTGKGFTWNNITVNDERFCYMYPTSFGALTSIIDGNGFSQMSSYTRYSVNITDPTTGNVVPYYAYLLTDATTGTGFKQVYA